jgi:superfamily II DNA helicase RecQ
MEGLRYLIEELNSSTNPVPKTLIFANTISKVTDILLWLREGAHDKGRVYKDEILYDYKIDMYSGCTNESSKYRILQDFVKEDSVIRILVCTIAFGMGVNVSGLKRVIVYDVPSSAATLWQEIGRASRGGESGEGIIFVPEVSLSGTLGYEIRKNCVRKTLLSKFYGYVPNERESTHENCTQASCHCHLCRCCSFCSDTCMCTAAI